MNIVMAINHKEAKRIVTDAKKRIMDSDRTKYTFWNVIVLTTEDLEEIQKLDTAEINRFIRKKFSGNVIDTKTSGEPRHYLTYSIVCQLDAKHYYIYRCQSASTGIFVY